MGRTPAIHRDFRPPAGSARVRARPGQVAVLLCAMLLAACHRAPPQAVGTLEYDRIVVPAPASERIVSLDVREGERVRAGQQLARLEQRRDAASTEAALADARRQRAALEELQAGPRAEDIARARAARAAAQAQARETSAYLARVAPLGRQQLVAAAEVDRARAAAAAAAAGLREADETLRQLEAGTRREQVAQGRAALEAAAATAAAQEVLRDKLVLSAPRAGRVDSLPYHLGDQPPVGAPVAILLVGEAPHARVYVPASLRTRLRVGDAATVAVQGRAGVLAGRVRTLQAEPVFTPYFALAGDDAARLSYLAEVELTADAARQLPAGLPVRVDFPAAR